MEVTKTKIIPIIKYKLEGSNWWDYDTLEEAEAAIKSNEEDNIKKRRNFLVCSLVAKEFPQDLLGPSREQLFISQFIGNNLEIVKEIIKQVEELK